MSRVKVISLTRVQKQRLSALNKTQAKSMAFLKDEKVYAQYIEVRGPLECLRQFVWHDKASIWLPVATPTLIEATR